MSSPYRWKGAIKICRCMQLNALWHMHRHIVSFHLISYSRLRGYCCYFIAVNYLTKIIGISALQTTFLLNVWKKHTKRILSHLFVFGNYKKIFLLCNCYFWRKLNYRYKFFNCVYVFKKIFENLNEASIFVLIIRKKLIKLLVRNCKKMFLSKLEWALWFHRRHSYTGIEIPTSA